MSVRVVTDSTAYLPVDVVERHHIEVVPLHVVVGGKDRIERVDVTAAEVAAALRDYTIVTTSRPTPQAFLDSYRRLADEGATAIVSVHLSSQMSGTVEAAQLAAADSPVPVEVIDSETIGMALGFAVVTARRDGRRAGPPLDEVARAVRGRLDRSGVLFYVHTLEHLRRGGRIGAASALLGSALSIKPILAVRGGRIVPVEKVRTSARAIARMEALVAEHVRAGGVAVDLAVHHLDAAERAEAIVEQLPGVVPGARLVTWSSSVPWSGRTSGPAPSPSPCPRDPGEPLTDPAPAVHRVVSSARAARLGRRRRRRLPHRVDQPGHDRRPGARQGPRARRGRATPARPTRGGCSDASGVCSSGCSTCSRASCRRSSPGTPSVRTRHTSSASQRCSGTSGRRSCSARAARASRRRSARSSACTRWVALVVLVVFVVAFALTRWVAAGSIFGALAMLVIAVLVWTGHAPGDVWTGVWLTAIAASRARAAQEQRRRVVAPAAPSLSGFCPRLHRHRATSLHGFSL